MPMINAHHLLSCLKSVFDYNIYVCMSVLTCMYYVCMYGTHPCTGHIHVRDISMYGTHPCTYMYGTHPCTGHIHVRDTSMHGTHPCTRHIPVYSYIYYVDIDSPTRDRTGRFYLPTSIIVLCWNEYTLYTQARSVSGYYSLSPTNMILGFSLA
jgi:hypothetical protein